MFAEAAVVGQQLVECVREGTGAVLVDASAGLCTVTGVGVGVGCDPAACEVTAEVDGQCKTLEDSHDVVITAEAGECTETHVVVSLAVHVLIEVADRVEAGCGRTGGTIVILTVAVLIEQVVTVLILHIYRVDGRHELSGVPYVVGLSTGVLGLVGIGVGVTQIGAQTQPLGSLMVDTGAGRVTGEEGGDQHTFVTQVTGREVVLGPLITTVHTQLILLAESLSVGESVHPVLVPGRYCIRAYKTCGRVNYCIPCIILVGVVELTAEGVAHTGRCIVESIVMGVTLVDSCIVERFIHQFYIFILIYKVVAGNSAGLPADLSLEIHVYAAFLTFLGSDDNDTVGTTGTVQGSGRCVLQHGHRLDILRVDGVDITVIGDTVNHIQR
ncbi:unknown [Alistipes sp. CAG:831]|nr:unknown [Alistipes sp. CAG:831]